VTLLSTTGDNVSITLLFFHAETQRHKGRMLLDIGVRVRNKERGGQTL